MTQIRRFVERRKHERFKVKQGACIACISDDNKLGKIKDISKGGLAFHYRGGVEPSKGAMKVDILSVADDFYLRNLPARTVFGFELSATDPQKDLPKRQLSLQFEKLTYYHKLLLDFFLKKYTHR